jgi:transposase
MFTITNIGFINFYSVCKLLIKITQKCGNIPVSIVLDNARKQRCKLVQKTAKLFDVELLYLPAYSTNLNLIERLWKFVKKKCLYSKYYSDYDYFTQPISQCLAKTIGLYKKELDSLLSLNL